MDENTYTLYLYDDPDICGRDTNCLKVEEVPEKELVSLIRLFSLRGICVQVFAE